jgi:mannose-6-phosphate isomerase-like protein (cupin superfamily)
VTSRGKFDLARFPVHLGLDPTIRRLPEFTGVPAWYEAYARSVAADGAAGRLVSLHTFSSPWDSWEVHPSGDELVVCVRGSITLHQERDGSTSTVVLEEGEAVVNPPGVWHTADVAGSATALFITAGLGTSVRPR